jgi:hypothetical protein
MNSDNPQTKNSVAADGNIEDSNIIFGNNNSVTVHSQKDMQKRSPLCSYPDCKFESEKKCNSCGGVFCLKHIAFVPTEYYFFASKHWLCAKCLKEKADSQKSIATISIVFAILGSLLFLGDSDVICLGIILFIPGLYIGMVTGLNYLTTQSSFRKSFPDQEEVVKSTVVKQEQHTPDSERLQVEKLGIEVVPCPNCGTLNSLSRIHCEKCNNNLINVKPIRNPYL